MFWLLMKGCFHSCVLFHGLCVAMDEDGYDSSVVAIATQFSNIKLWWMMIMIVVFSNCWTIRHVRWGRNSVMNNLLTPARLTIAINLRVGPGSLVPQTTNHSNNNVWPHRSHGNKSNTDVQKIMGTKYTNQTYEFNFDCKRIYFAN